MRHDRAPQAAGPRLTVTIERLSLGGEGVAHARGLVVFVPYAVPGDELEIQLIEQKARYARGRLLRVIKPGANRITPPCPYHFQAVGPLPVGEGTARRAGGEGWCGGCSWQQIAYPAQLEAKRQLVAETLERIGGLRGVSVRPTLGMAEPWRYRNKVQQPVGWDAAGRRLITGFYTPESHDIMPIEDCLVQPALSVAIINRARALLERFGARAYDEQSRTGWIRHLLVRTAGESAMLSFITRTPDFPHEEEIASALVREFPALAGIHQNVNPAQTNVILGRQWRKVAGAEFIEERLGRLRFRLSPGSFFQVNSSQAEVLYGAVARVAGRGERLLDLYCGVGGIALWLADQFEEVGGVEDVRAAVENAEENAELNGITNARFIAAPVESFLRSMPRTRRPLTVSLDPPRAGCEAAVLSGLLYHRPERIIYTSCDPGTLARDVKVLAEGGYLVRDIQPVDLFPQTAHIETVVLLEGQPS